MIKDISIKARADLQEESFRDSRAIGTFIHEIFSISELVHRRAIALL